MAAIRTAVAGIADELASPPPVRAAIYCRLSRTGGRSVERQEQDGRQIADEHGWQVVEVFHEWESASEFARKTPANGGRKEWQRLLEGIEISHFDVVIVWAEDRSNRDLAQGIEFARLCERAGVRLVLPSYDYDLADPEHRNRFYGEVLNAQREVARLSKRVRRARLEEAESGRRHPGGERPFGERGRRRLPDGRTVPIVSADRAAAERVSIRDAATRVLAGDSLRGIVLDWNGEPGQSPHVPPPVGGRWTTQSLKRMLTSPRMAGLREHHGKRYPSTEIEPVLDEATWQAVRAVLLDPTRRVTAVGGVARHLLSGLAFCGVCGAKLEAYGRNGQRSYRCPAPARGGRRCVKRLADPVERLILRAVFMAVENPTWHEAAAERPTDDPTRPHYERLAELTADLDTLDGMLAEAELAERQGRKPQPSAATLRRKLADREAEQERHQAAVSRLQHGRVAAAVPRNLRGQWTKLSLDRRRAILAAMIERIEVHPQGRGPFDPDAIKVKRRR